jgi:hypothetical protein
LSLARGSVLINGSPTNEFSFKRGLRQGDPLSPALFIIAMEALSLLFNKAEDAGAFSGIQLPNNGPKISHLIYADDVIFLGEWSEENVRNLNRFLRVFQLVSWLSVNLAKSNLFGVGAIRLRSNIWLTS